MTRYVQTCIQKSLIMWNVSSSFFFKFILFKLPLFYYCTFIISKTLLPLKVIFISVFVKQWKYLCSGKNISWQAFLNENFRGYISPLRAECVVDQRVQPSISCPLWKCEGQSITQLINTSCQQPVTHCHTVTVTQQPVTHCHTVTLTSCLLTINTVIITLKMRLNFRCEIYCPGINNVIFIMSVMNDNLFSVERNFYPLPESLPSK